MEKGSPNLRIPAVPGVSAYVLREPDFSRRLIHLKRDDDVHKWENGSKITIEFVDDGPGAPNPLHAKILEKVREKDTVVGAICESDDGKRTRMFGPIADVIFMLKPMIDPACHQQLERLCELKTQEVQNGRWR